MSKNTLGEKMETLKSDIKLGPQKNLPVLGDHQFVPKSWKMAMIIPNIVIARPTE